MLNAQHSSEYSIQGRQLHRIRRIESSWCNRLIPSTRSCCPTGMTVTASQV